MPKLAKFTEATLAANHYVDTLLPRADVQFPYPLWHGWALREAFEAGVKWQMEQRNPQEGK